MRGRARLRAPALAALASLVCTTPAAGAGCADFPAAELHEEARASVDLADGASAEEDATVAPDVLCLDQDRDRASTCLGDCDDSDAEVRPDQRDFFEVPANGGGFDYDCNGVQERQYERSVACAWRDYRCAGEGWEEGALVPACGQTGPFVSCGGFWCREEEAEPRVQRCR